MQSSHSPTGYCFSWLSQLLLSMMKIIMQICDPIMFIMKLSLSMISVKIQLLFVSWWSATPEQRDTFKVWRILSKDISSKTSGKIIFQRIRCRQLKLAFSRKQNSFHWTCFFLFKLSTGIRLPQTAPNNNSWWEKQIGIFGTSEMVVVEKYQRQFCEKHRWSQGNSA